MGLILGITSLKHVQPRGPKAGRGMAIAGIVLCAVFIALMAAGLLLISISSSTTNSFD